MPIVDACGLCWAAVLACRQYYRGNGVLRVELGGFWHWLNARRPELVLEARNTRHLPPHLCSNATNLVQYALRAWFGGNEDAVGEISHVVPWRIRWEVDQRRQLIGHVGCDHVACIEDSLLNLVGNGTGWGATGFDLDVVCVDQLLDFCDFGNGVQLRRILSDLYDFGNDRLSRSIVFARHEVFIEFKEEVPEAFGVLDAILVYAKLLSVLVGVDDVLQQLLLEFHCVPEPLTSGPSCRLQADHIEIQLLTPHDALDQLGEVRLPAPSQEHADGVLLLH